MVQVCEHCGCRYGVSADCREPSELDSIVPARMPEQSNPEALAGDSSVPGDSLRKIRELAENAHFAVGTRQYDKAMTAINRIRELCSHENSKPTETA